MVKDKADATAELYASITELLNCKVFTQEIADKILNELLAIEKFQG